MADESKKDRPKRSLDDEEIVSAKEPDVGRRKALGMFGITAASAVALATGCGRRRARAVRVQTGGITDNDSGPCADPAGGGVGVTGITDNDGGQCADAVNRGRGGARQVSGITDSDAGRYADPAGNGRGGGGRTGITDRDRGPCADPAGGGRGYSGLTDSDAGTCADPGGRGRSGY